MTDARPLLARLPRLKTESQDFLHLDALRIVAALGIVLFHFMGELRLSATGKAFRSHLVSLNLMVDLFFVISGIIIAHSYAHRMNGWADWRGFMQKRLARLAPLHWATLLAFIGLQAWLQPARFARLDWGCVAPTAAFLHAMPICAGLRFNFPAWSIGAEMLIYAAFPLLLLTRRAGWAGPFAAAAALLIPIYAVGKVGPFDRAWWEWTFDWGLLRAVPSFLIGMGLYGVRGALGRLPAPRLWFAASIIAFIAGMALDEQKGLLVLGVYAIAAAALAADQHRKAGPVVRGLAPWGQLTFSVYMLHAFFLLFFIQYLPPRTGLSHNLLIAASFPLLLALSYLSLFGFEQPMRRWVAKLGRGKKGDGGGDGLLEPGREQAFDDLANYAPGVTPASAASAPGSPALAPQDGHAA